MYYYSPLFGSRSCICLSPIRYGYRSYLSQLPYSWNSLMLDQPAFHQRQRSTWDNFLVDGVDNNDYFGGAAAQIPSIDSIQEFEVQTNTFAPRKHRLRDESRHQVRNQSRARIGLSTFS